MLPTWPNDAPFRRKDQKKVFMLSDRVELSSAEARVEEIQGGSVEVLDLTQGFALAHTPNPSQPF